MLERWKNADTFAEPVDLKTTQALLYGYTCINMSETKLYKAKSQLNWNLIGGLNEIKKSLTESLIWPIKYKELYKKLSMKQSGGVLLYGPSGCGKTLIALVFKWLWLKRGNPKRKKTRKICGKSFKIAYEYYNKSLDSSLRPLFEFEIR